MKRRDFLRKSVETAGLAALGGTWSGCRSLQVSEREATEKQRPNLLYVFTDQHSHDMLGCYGNEQIITPNLDAFSGQGVRFSTCISSYPVCTPYRSILMSGQNPLYSGCLRNDVQLSPGNGRKLGEVLRDAGYRMGYVGKWHLLGGNRKRNVPAGPLRYGFDDFFYTNNCTLDFRPGHGFYYDENDEIAHFDEWEVYGQTRQAIEFLDGCNAEQPWALFVSWHPPHDSWPGNDQLSRYTTLPEFMDLYDPNEIRIRPNAPEIVERTREDYHGYMARITGCDKAFGRLLDKLRERNMEDNTIVVFTADHGDHLPGSPWKKTGIPGSNGRPWTKGFPEDASVRVPLLLRWPGHLDRRESDLLVCSLDLMPSLLGLMGLPIPEVCQGKDLSRAIRNGDDHSVESVPLFHFGTMGWRGVVTRDYTYSIDYAQRFPGAELVDQDRDWPAHARWNVLYDRKNDPWQLQNLFGARGHRRIQRNLHDLMMEWLRYFEDEFEYGRFVWDASIVEQGPDRKVRGRPIDLVKAARRS